MHTNIMSVLACPSHHVFCYLIQSTFSLDVHTCTYFVCIHHSKDAKYIKSFLSDHDQIPDILHQIFGKA